LGERELIILMMAGSMLRAGSVMALVDLGVENLWAWTRECVEIRGGWGLMLGTEERREEASLRGMIINRNSSLNQGIHRMRVDYG
jgi:hypothetical protein